MNREKHLNKADRKTRTCLNDSACQNVDDSQAAGLARQHHQHQLLDRSVYDGFSLGRLNSDRTNAEVNSVPHCDLLTFHNQKAGAPPSESYQGRTVGNSDDYQRRQKLTNKKKKKKKNCGRGYIHTNFACTAVPVSTEDAAAGLMSWQMHSVGHSSGWQDHIDVQHSQPNTFQREPFSSDDRFLSAAAVTATVAASEKVFHTSINSENAIVFQLI